MSEQQRASDDDEHWTQPPPSEDGAPAWVDLGLNLKRIHSVDTVASTTYAHVSTVLYWNDPRLVGWPEGKPLPPALWGPMLKLDNALADFQSYDIGFVLVNADTGRLKRSRHYRGTVDNPMELHAFPFDLDNVEFSLKTTSTWESLDGTRGGGLAKGKSYRLRQNREPDETDWVTMLWNGQVAEWELHGVSTDIYERPANKSGSENTMVSINFHLSRKSGYYFWKALLPLYLLTALSMSTFQLDTDSLPDRNSTVSTYFLAAFAMLYVVGEALPKTDFLTKIDVTIVISTISLALTGLFSMALAKLHKEIGEEVAERWNMIAGTSLSSFYVLANLVIFVPAWLKQRSAVAQLSTSYKRASTAHAERTSDSEKNPMIVGGVGETTPPPTVREGHEYITLADLTARVPVHRPRDSP